MSLHWGPTRSGRDRMLARCSHDQIYLPVEPPLHLPLRGPDKRGSTKLLPWSSSTQAWCSLKSIVDTFPPHLERYTAVIALRRHKGTESLISAPPSAAKIFRRFLTFRRLQQQFKDFAFKRGCNFPKRIHSEINLFAFKLRDGNTLKTSLKGKALL
jgi:hypothetical protein